MSTRDDEKAAAARESLKYIRPGMVVGLGSGSTASIVIQLIGEQVSRGLKIRGVPTSGASGTLAKSLGIPLTTFEEVDSVDVTIDGADEIAPGLQLIKGGGGFLLHEKIVAAASKQVVIVADQKKKVAELGRFPLPVEVVRFAVGPVKRQLEQMKAAPRLRTGADDEPFVTDEGNWIFDCAFGRIPDPPAIARRLESVPGIVGHGLFLGLASLAIVAGSEGIEVLTA
ncbi:MAG TPA: ribose-5-phosphate isomerase RpiA [Acidobacteriaceae bacterium]|nr:ribose-5-phosphate isomerase RpiA [Acidobacteriaceae bacterium]